ncbi:Uma2 family endonuclease [bacterium]|nr:Uma2 family endonuclease [bacterium]
MKDDPRKDRLSEAHSSYRVDSADREQTDLPNGHTFEEPISEAGKWVSEEDYWEHYFHHPDFNYEWNDGILEEKPVSDVATISIYQWFAILLYSYLEANPIAKSVMLEFAVRLSLPYKTAIRKPDLAVVLNDNLRPLVDQDRSYQGVYDLAVEALSDSLRSEKERDLVVKYAEYEEMGIREYYILHTDERNLRFYRLNDNGRYEPIPPSPDGVIRSQVLPGFQFRIADLLRRPTLFELANDPLYQDFVFYQYQVAKQYFEAEQQRLELRAEQEQQRAEQEQQRAEEERKRAERLAARLRELGISEDDL